MEAQQVETLLHFCRVTVLSVAQRNRDRTFLTRGWLLLRLFVTQLWSLRAYLWRRSTLIASYFWTSPERGEQHFCNLTTLQRWTPQRLFFGVRSRTSTFG